MPRNPYVPQNMPAIGDLMEMFAFNNTNNNGQ